MSEPLLMTGAWQAGRDHPGQRKFFATGTVFLRSGGELAEVVVAFETYGTLNPTASNAVLIEHALTGDSHVAGAIETGHVTPGWWDNVVGPGKTIDTNEYFVVAANVLGGCQGTTGPSSPAPDGRPWGSRFPRIGVEDQVAVEALLSNHLGIARWNTVVGGSMGAMRALQWGYAYPDRVGSIAVLASSTYATAAQIATQTTQINIIKSDPHFYGGDYYDGAEGAGPERGLALARQVAFLSYRSEAELDERFASGDSSAPGVQSYLDYQGNKLVRRFDANSYIVLNEVMNAWSLGSADGFTGADGWKHALSTVQVPAVVVGIDSDQLFPLRLQQQLAIRLPNCIGPLVTVKSDFGHDGFLLETDQLHRPLRSTLNAGRPSALDSTADDAETS